jgi:nicotinamidase-related amidase
MSGSRGYASSQALSELCTKASVASQWSSRDHVVARGQVLHCNRSFDVALQDLTPIAQSPRKGANLMKLDAYPYAFPLKGYFEPATTAILSIDFQVDFCGPGGYMDRMGVDISLMRAALSPAASVIAAAREHGFMVAHTRETFHADLSDVQPHRFYRGESGTDIIPGDDSSLGRCLIKGEPCWEIVPEVAPREGERIFDKSAYGAFGCTDIEASLKSRGIRHLVLTGLTSNCCIQSNLREALDRGFECVVLEDCCGASSQAAHDHSMALITSTSAVFGLLSTSSSFLETLGRRESVSG